MGMTIFRLIADPPGRIQRGYLRGMIGYVCALADMCIDRHPWSIYIAGYRDLKTKEKKLSQLVQEAQLSNA